MSLVRKSLRTELRGALHQAARTQERVTQCGLAVDPDASDATVNLIVRPFTEAGVDSGFYLVVFQEVMVAAGAPPGAPPASEAAAQQLAHDLRSTREQLQATIDELESANQELQSANEELLSMNEELQSANEELQSSKEETQSVNAELESVNTELTHKVGELDTARSDLESLFEGTQIATVFLDNDLSIKRFTPTATELFRLREGDVGRPVTDITTRFTNGDMMAELRDVLRTLQRKELPVTRVDDGTHYLMRILPYRTRQNVIDGVAIAFVDVTELKRTEDALRESGDRLRAADQAKDEFLAMLSHELRNPLSAIANSIQLWRALGREEPKLERARDVAERQVKHVAHLVEDLMDTARITRGKVELQRQPLDLRQVVEDAVDATAPRTDDRRQSVSVALPGEPLPVDGDPERLHQVVSNLLSNAARYTPVGGSIWVAAKAVAPDTTHHAGQAEIRVRDNGVGIAPGLLPRIFDLFVQAQRGSDRAGGGLGLGLTLVRQLVEMHGGSVEAHSEGEGKGSEFVVRLPLCGSAKCGVGSAKWAETRFDVPAGGATTPTTGIPATPHSALSTPHSRRILLVDDNADAAEVQGDLLEIEGHEVVVVHDGPTALHVAPEYHPDVVLLDIGLPGMDGYEVARRLRQEPALAGTMLVALTGYGQEEDRQRSREAGFDEHLVKPVDMGALLRVLATSKGGG